jgi:V-type H+-transporting ATPase subunit a
LKAIKLWTQNKYLYIKIKDDAKIIKSVFVIVYPGGGGSNVITNKLNKICESFQVAKYTFPENNMIF